MPYTPYPAQKRNSSTHLLVILLLLSTITLLSGLGLLSADTAGAASTEGRGERKVDVLLRVETDDERGNVDDLLADADVTLADQDTGVVDRLGETELVDAGLEAALQEILSLEGKDVIELHAGLVEHTDAHETANEGIALEEALGVLLVERKKLTADMSARHFQCMDWGASVGMDLPSGTTDLGEGEEDTPNLTLVAKTELANELELGVPGAAELVDDHNRHEQSQARAQWPVMWACRRTSIAAVAAAQRPLGGIRDQTHNRAASKGRRGTLAVFEYERGAILVCWGFSQSSSVEES